MTIVFGPSADTTSWAEARTKVRSDLWRPSASALPDDVVDRALHAAIQEIEAERRWLWLENVQGAVTMPADASSVNVGGAVASITSLAYLTGTHGYDVLNAMTLPRVRANARGGSIGWPDAYALSNGQIYFDTTLKAGSQLEMVFSAQCPVYVSEAVTSPNVTLELHENAVLPLACMNLALGFLKNDEDARRFEARYQRRMQTMFNAEDHARADIMGSGVVPDVTYQEAAYGP